MSRAFGNRMLKQFVVAEPEIQVILDYCVNLKINSLLIARRDSLIIIFLDN